MINVPIDFWGGFWQCSIVISVAIPIGLRRSWREDNSVLVQLSHFLNQEQSSLRTIECGCLDLLGGIF